MQIGQVPIQFVPEPVVNDTRSITMEAETDDIMIPSLAPLAPEPVAVVEEPRMWGTWAALAGLLVFAWLMTRPGR